MAAQCVHVVSWDESGGSQLSPGMLTPPVAVFRELARRAWTVEASPWVDDCRPSERRVRLI
eukprot:4987204-Prymnesium_polylepis.1